MGAESDKTNQARSDAKKPSGPLWTVRYTLLNATYFVAFCTIHACAAVFLLANGFTNTEVGILLAVANILSAIAQPLIAGVIDKPGPLTNRRFILFSVLVILAGSVILMFVPDNKFVIFPVFALIYMIQFAYQPVMTALCFEYQKAGCPIFYGLARGLGSASFAVTSALIGGLVEKRLIEVEPTTLTLAGGTRCNGTLEYHLLNPRIAVDHFNAQALSSGGLRVPKTRRVRPRRERRPEKVSIPDMAAMDDEENELPL